MSEMIISTIEIEDFTFEHERWSNGDHCVCIKSDACDVEVHIEVSAKKARLIAEMFKDAGLLGNEMTGMDKAYNRAVALLENKTKELIDMRRRFEALQMTNVELESAIKFKYQPVYAQYTKTLMKKGLE